MVEKKECGVVKDACDFIVGGVGNNCDGLRTGSSLSLTSMLRTYSSCLSCEKLHS